MPKEVIRTDLAPRPLADYSQAWAVTGAKLIFVSGQVSVDMDGNTVGAGDIALQTRTVLENVKKVLMGAGAEMGDVIKLNMYVTNIAEFKEKSPAVRREYFSHDFPASTLVEIQSLARPEFMIEIEAIAAVEGEATLDLTGAVTIGGSFGTSVTAISSATTLNTTHHVVTCDASGGAFTVTLPAANGAAGRMYHVKKIDSSGNAVTVDANASETIDGDTTKIVSTQYDSMMIVCDGSNWHIV